MGVSLLHLSLLVWRIESQTIINGIWNDDFTYDDGGITGWWIYNWIAGDLGNSIVEGQNNRYHGPYTKTAPISSAASTYIVRTFECLRESKIFISYSIAYCETSKDEIDGTDWFRLMALDSTSNAISRIQMDPSLGMPFADYETEEPFNTNVKIADNDGDYVTNDCDNVNEYYYQNISNVTTGSRNASVPFTVTFRSSVSDSGDEWVLVYDISIECEAYPYSTDTPTTEPTSNPSTGSPTIAPTEVPSTFGMSGSDDGSKGVYVAAFSGNMLFLISMFSMM